MDSASNTTPSGRKRDVSRRTWLRGLGVAGIGAIAGCNDTGRSGTTNTQTGDPPTNANGEPMEPVIDEIMGTSAIPADIQWNPWATPWSGNLAGFAMEYGGLLSAKGELILSGFDDWSFDGDENALTIVLDEELKNWNGDRWTASDMMAYWGVVHHQAPESSQWEQLEVVDKSTARFYYKEPQNPDLLKNVAIHGSIIGWNEDIWGPWVDRYKDAADQDERDQISKELVETIIPHSEFQEKGLGTSPYKLDAITEQEVIFKRWDGHRLADDIEIETIRRPYAANQAREDELITSDQVDFENGPLNQRFEGQVPDYIQNLTTWQGKWLIKMLINWRNREYLQDVNVRRAMAAVIDTEAVATSVGSGNPVKVHSGMDYGFTEKYAGNQMDKYIDYGSKADYELADEYLAKSGYSRENGTVVDENGDELEKLRFVAGTAKSWFLPAQVASAQLKEYGFNVEFNSVERGTKLDIVENKMGDWDLSTESHYAGSTYHPISYFNWGSFWGWRLAKGRFGAAAGSKQQLSEWLDQGEEFSPYNGKPLTPEVPTEIGAQDLSGETKRVNVFELYEEAHTPISQERTNEIIQDLSWAWNFYVPDIDLYNAQQGCWADTKNFDWPDDETVLQIVNGGGPGYCVQHGLTKYNYK
ncbi:MULTISPECIES: ABC transporter substrate-binding protein [unclassified Haladaptatus]|uniref:ABC transporter substrate-binding protein n=1 Tax=unclassified Haladaptatus TaxID=2622732 RepID=UPI0023E80574|nr:MULTISPECIES: ABC transporter substrate-binding protein [unclassified Haladaptatus]